jgi:peptidoglycan/xylan/chitin deacetylase (PgdA/CDA1 family)
MRSTLLLATLLSALLVGGAFSQSKTIALTIDDAPHNGPVDSIGELTQMTKTFTDTLKKHGVPAVVFVNEGQVYYRADEVEEKIAVLRQWALAGVELGNHTFGHVGLKDMPLEKYQDDFIRGEVISRRISDETKLPLRYFRHPFLQMGPTRETEDAFELFLENRGYTAVPITLTSEDWMFAPAYRKAANAGDAKEQKRISDDYVKFAQDDIEYRDRAAREMFGRPIAHILLVHANRVTADNLERLIKMYTSLGFKFVTVEEALKDPIYTKPERYTATSDWLRAWSISKGLRLDTPQPPEYIRKSSAN